jgi:hypothetical protein
LSKNRISGLYKHELQSFFYPKFFLKEKILDKKNFSQKKGTTNKRKNLNILKK